MFVEQSGLASLDGSISDSLFQNHNEDCKLFKFLDVISISYHRC